MFVAVTMLFSAIPVNYWGKLQKVHVSSFCSSFGVQGSEGYVVITLHIRIIQSFAAPLSNSMSGRCLLPFLKSPKSNKFSLNL